MQDESHKIIELYIANMEETI